MKRPKLYLAGPMRGYEDFNFGAFFRGEEYLKARGYEVHNPAREDVESGFQYQGTTGHEDISELWGDETPRSLRDVLAEDLEWIARNADGVAVLPGWEHSKGARAEVSLALAIGITVAPVEDYLTAYGEVGIAGAGIRSVPDPVMADALRIGLSRTPAVDEEVRVTSETGGQKGQKLAQLGSLDPQALLTVAKVSGFGAQKYARYNFMKGYDWSLSFDAMMRHLLAFWGGEDVDPESGLPHLGHAAWHCLALLAFSQRQLGTDDRYRQEESAA